MSHVSTIFYLTFRFSVVAVYVMFPHIVFGYEALHFYAASAY